MNIGNVITPLCVVFLSYINCDGQFIAVSDYIPNQVVSYGLKLGESIPSPGAGSGGLKLAVDIDPINETLKFTDFSFRVNAITFSHDYIVSKGFGNTTTYNISVSFDQLDFNFTGATSASLILSGVNRYRIVDDNIKYQHVGSPVISGSYQITGNGETVNGHFSEEIPSSVYFNVQQHYDIYLNTTDYPNYVYIDGDIEAYFYGSSQYQLSLFDENINGDQISGNISSLMIRTRGNRQLYSIPEPATATLTITLMSLFGVIYYKRRQSQNSGGFDIGSTQMGSCRNGTNLRHFNG